MPRLTQAKTARVIETLTDSARFLHAPSYGMKNSQQLIEICVPANAVTMSYVLFHVNKGIEA